MTTLSYVRARNYYVCCAHVRALGRAMIIFSTAVVYTFFVLSTFCQSASPYVFCTMCTCVRTSQRLYCSADHGAPSGSEEPQRPSQRVARRAGTASAPDEDHNVMVRTVATAFKHCVCSSHRVGPLPLQTRNSRIFHVRWWVGVYASWRVFRMQSSPYVLHHAHLCA